MTTASASSSTKFSFAKYQDYGFYYQVLLPISFLFALASVPLFVDYFLHPFQGSAYLDSPIFRLVLMIASVSMAGLAFVCIRNAAGNVIGPVLLILAACNMFTTIRSDAPEITIVMLNTFSGLVFWPTFIFMLSIFPTGWPYFERIGNWINFFFLLIGIVIIPFVYLIGSPTLIHTPLNPENTIQIENPLNIPNINFVSLIPAILSPVMLTYLIYVLVSQVLRFRHANPREGQQLKWFLFGLAIWIIPVVIANLPFTPKWLYDPLTVYMTIGAFFFVPIFVGIAVLRYRLWDIDIIINRSIVYGTVASILVALIALIIFAYQTVAGNTQLNIAFGISLVVAALIFNPVMKAIQSFVDRYIFRLNFDLNQLAAAQKKPEIKNAGALTGKKLGQYEVLDFIGKGGMGEVYKGFANGKTVALKTLAANLATERDFKHRFQREAEVMQSLEHPKIVKLYESGESEGQRFLAMEFIEGIELKDYLRNKGKLPLEEVKEILCDVAAALDYLHGKAIVHRDIKPSNVMLRGDELQEAILMDFGIAKIEDDRTRLTGSGAIGTIDYMSPEQILAAKEVDKRSDVYALGVIAYEMLTGERPFEGNAAQVMFAHLQKPVTDPRQHRSDLSENVAKAVMKALEKLPEDRFESAGAFAGALG
jgi:predicted Ser/Thr protein kinase